MTAIEIAAEKQRLETEITTVISKSKLFNEPLVEISGISFSRLESLIPGTAYRITDVHLTVEIIS